VAALLTLVLCSLERPSIVDRDRGFSSEAGQNPLGTLAEYRRLFMAEE